jgi:elongation factor Ts
MEITLDKIKELRQRTGAGLTIVKEALENSGGDMDKAIHYLREKGVAKATKRAGMNAENGFIAHYIHGEGTIAVLVELNSETDFTARNTQFRELARSLAVHIAAASPEYRSIEDIPAPIMEREREIAMKTVEGNKPKEVMDKIVEGKMQKFYEETVLLEQKYVRDDSKKIKDLVNETVAAIGEKIEIGRFCRIQIAGPSNSCGLINNEDTV